MPNSSTDEESVAEAHGHTESSPLLRAPERRNASQALQSLLGISSEQEESEVFEDRHATPWQHEVKVIAAWSAPLIVSYFLQRSITFISVFAVGRLGTTELGAVSLASITTNLLGNSMIQGLANGLDTLAGQAFGSGNLHLVGLYTQRMVYFTHLCALPLMVLWLQADHVLDLFIPDKEVAALAGLYLKIMVLRVPAFIIFECGKRFTQSQGLFYPGTLVLLICAPLNGFLMWLFIWHFGWGFVGGPIAIVISDNLMALLLVLYVCFIDGSQCWGGLTKKALTNWGPMINLAVPGMIMHITEFAIEEILTVVAAQFGTIKLAAQSALVTLVNATFTVPLGGSVAAATRAANWIGAGKPQSAKTAGLVAISFGLTFSLINTIFLASVPHKLALLFTKDAEVIRVIVQTMPIVATMQTPDIMAAYSAGLLRSIGSQWIGGYINIVVFYFIALPISLCTAFSLHWDLYGLWTGMTVGMFLVCIIEYWWLFTSDWDDAVEKTIRRNELSR